MGRFHGALCHASSKILVKYITLQTAGFSLRILVAGERCNVTGEYSEKGSTAE